MTPSKTTLHPFFIISKQKNKAGNTVQKQATNYSRKRLKFVLAFRIHLHYAYGVSPEDRNMIKAAKKKSTLTPAGRKPRRHS